VQSDLAHRPAMQAAGYAVAVAEKPCRDERLVVAHQPVGPGTERVERNS